MKKSNNIFKRIFLDIKRKITKSKNKFTIVEVLSFMIVTFALGLITGGIIVHGRDSYNGNISTSLDEFVATYNDILKNYYEPVDADELMEAGINGMVNYLGDPYAAYFNVEESKEFNEYLDGKYCGIGAEIQKDDSGYIKISNVFSNSPSEKANILVGDLIIKVNGEDIKGRELKDVTSVVKGEQGTKVVLTIKRDKKEFDVDVVRDFVDISSVTSKIIEEKGKKIGYLEVSIFAENTDSQFEEELKKLEKDNIDSLIIDLRSNTGGHLKTVTNMISLFIKKGEVIYQLKTKDEIEKVKDKTDDYRNYQVVILIDGASASASEVFTAALKEQYNAIIIGTTSYGKGKVQKSYQLSSGSMIKYTYQEWLTPNGNYIDGVGIKPDIEVDYSKDGKSDNQLNRAITELVK